MCFRFFPIEAPKRQPSSGSDGPLTCAKCRVHVRRARLRHPGRALFFLPACRLDLVDQLREHILTCPAVLGALGKRLERGVRLIKTRDELRTASEILAAESQARSQRIRDLKVDRRSSSTSRPCSAMEARSAFAAWRVTPACRPVSCRRTFRSWRPPSSSRWTEGDVACAAARTLDSRSAKRPAGAGGRGSVTVASSSGTQRAGGPMDGE